MTYDFFNQLLISFYNLTSFQLGDYSFAEIAVNTQDAFLGSSFVHILQFVSALLIALLAVGAVYLAERHREFNQQVAQQVSAVAEVAVGGPLQAQWNDIMLHIESTREGEWKFAIIEADSVVDSVLKNYFPGDTMGERLKSIDRDKTKLLSIDGLWEAHMIRNKLSHEPNYFLRHAEALRAIRYFEATLKELGAIE
ncbi:MAG: hypothetical protein AAB638_03785 [Patescibacteria group bacterium]